MIVAMRQLASLRRRLAHRRIVLAGGTFDLFHRGHIKALRNLRNFGDTVVIAVSTDIRVRERKGPARPILNQRQRLAIVNAIRYVDYALLSPPPKATEAPPTIRILAAL